MDSCKFFEGRILLRQRVLAKYRVAMYDTLVTRAQDFELLFGQPRFSEAIKVADRLPSGKSRAVANKYVGFGALQCVWQHGFLSRLAEFSPDILIAEANPRLVDTYRASRWMHKQGRCIIGWGLGLTSYTKGLATARKAFRRRFMDQFDGMIAYSSVAAQQYHEMGFEKERVFVAINSVQGRPSDDLAPRPDRFDVLPQILFIGRLVDKKRVDKLLLAADRLTRRKTPISVTVVGDGPSKPALERLASQLEVNTTFSGHKEGHDLARIAQQADLFVLPGLGGLAIQEAMAFGLPVIVVEADGTENDLIKGNGWVLRDLTVESLADAIHLAVSDVTRLREMGRESFRIVKEYANVDAMVDRVIEAAHAINRLGVRKR